MAPTPSGRIAIPVAEFPLICLIAKTYNYDDELFFRDLTGGMPIVGRAPTSHAPTDRERPANSSIVQWREEIPLRTKLNVERAKRTQGTAVEDECWAKTTTEVQRGWIT